jgi:hypothetical protein
MEHQMRSLAPANCGWHRHIAKLTSHLFAAPQQTCVSLFTLHLALPSTLLSRPQTPVLLLLAAVSVCCAIMAVAVAMPQHGIDTGALSAFLDIDGPDLQDIVNSAAGGVVFLLQQVQQKAREFQEVADAKTQLEVDYGI